MATSFDEIYCLNAVIKSDIRLSQKPSYELELLNWKYLQFAIKEFMYDCRKDLTDYIPFTSVKYSFTGNGVDNIFQLTPAPELDMTPEFYIGVQAACGQPVTVISKYQWDNENNTLTLDSAPLPGSNIEIVVYQSGQFNEDLSIDEKTILADAMNIPYFEEAISNRKILDFTVYGGSIKMHSQAEHEKVLLSALSEQRNLVMGEISNYSYRTAPFGYAGLGARTTCYYPHLCRHPHAKKP